ncbi:MAG: glycosyltransferase [Anaerolineae bacterium]|nr:glycosyltransferase [Anaerolineae bacterium]MDW8172244.1 glycosyltransferase [Anaerolineae bacterium]
MTAPRISLIVTVLNEADNIARLLDSLLAQTRLPDEVVIVDGGSTDGTQAILSRYRACMPLQVIVQAGCNISQGRNLAIQHANGDILAITDAGVVLPADWLERLCAPLLADESLHVSAGFFVADPHNVFEAALGATTLPSADEIQPERFLPSSRSVAVRRAAALAVGGYPEWLDYCEDLIFDLRLQARYAPFVFVPQAAVRFRPRPNLRAFYKQYRLYARGDGKADLWRARHAVRYGTYLVGGPGLLALSLLASPWFAALLLLGLAAYLRRPYLRLPQVMARLPFRPTARHWLAAWAWIPVVRVVGDVAKMHGYPQGWRWRLAHEPPSWRL